jgi:DNA-binding SARP family transcriptional activator
MPLDADRRACKTLGSQGDSHTPTATSAGQQSDQDLRIQLLGRFIVSMGGKTVDEAELRLRKAKTLIKLLALAPDHRLHRAQIIELLWPDLDSDAANNNFRKALHVARRAVDPRPEATSRYLQLRDEQLLLVSPGELWIDVDAWSKAARQARRAGDVASHRAAIDVYSGDLLPEDRFEEWAMARRDELREEFLTLLVSLALLHERSGGLSSAIECFRRVVAAEPSREEAHAGLMRAYAESGRRHQAIRQYEHLREALRRELDVEPEISTQRLHEEIQQGRFPDRPPRLAARGAPEGTGRGRLPLVGRDAQIEALQEMLDGLFAGRGGLVLLAGEAGAGKTTAASEIAERARRRGAIVLCGAGHEQEGRLPYGPFAEAFDEFARQTPPGILAPLIGDAGRELVRLAPGLAAVLGADTADTADRRPDRARLFAAIAGFVARLAFRAPLVVLLDDLHATDDESLELLHYLVRSSEIRSQLFLGTFRPEETAAGDPLGQFLASLRRERVGIRLDLPRLGPHDIEVLVARLLGDQPVDQAVLEAIWELSAGNPFYAEEAVTALRESGVLEQADGRWRLKQRIGAVPGPLAELVAARLGRLGSASRQVLNIAAVIGIESPYALLEGTAEMSRRELLDALDDCLARRVLEEGSRGYQFDHPLHRAAVYDDLSTARRAVLHGRVASALEQSQHGAAPSDAESLAHHYSLSDVPWRAVPHLVLAGDRAAGLHANESAARHYERALELAMAAGATPETTSVVPEVLEKLGDLRGLFGEGGTTEVDAYRSAIAAPAAIGRDAGLTRLHRKAARASLRLWDVTGAAPHLAEADALMRAHPDEAERGRVSMVRAHLFWQSGRYDEAVEAAQESIALAHSHGDPADLANGYEVLAIALHFRGTWQDGLHLEIERLGPALDAGEAHLAHVVDMHHCLGQQHLYRDRSRGEVEAYARRSVDLAARAGARRVEAFAWCLLGESLLVSGRWSEAIDCINRSIKLRQELGPETVALPWQRLAEIAVYRGESPEPYLRQGMSITMVSPMAQHAWGRLYATEGLDALERGDLTGALHAVEGAAAAAERYGECPGCCSLLHPVAAEAYAAAGNPDAAERHAEAVERLAGRWESTAVSAMAETAWGSVALARGDSAEAAARFLSASEMHQRLGQPFWAGRTLFQAGQVRAESGQIEQARDLLRRALGLFERLGAERAAASTRRELERVTDQAASFGAAGELHGGATPKQRSANRNPSSLPRGVAAATKGSAASRDGGEQDANQPDGDGAGGPQKRR